MRCQTCAPELGHSDAMPALSILTGHRIEKQLEMYLWSGSCVEPTVQGSHSPAPTPVPHDLHPLCLHDCHISWGTFSSSKCPRKAWPCCFTLSESRGDMRSKGKAEQKGKQESMYCLGERGQRVTDNHPLSAHCPPPMTERQRSLCSLKTLCNKRALVLDGNLKMPLPLAVRTYFLGGLSAEAREGQAALGYLERPFDSVTNLQHQKGNTLGGRGQGSSSRRPGFAEWALERTLEHTCSGAAFPALVSSFRP